jgi:DNA-directed RNA polymerase subunit K/omega
MVKETKPHYTSYEKARLIGARALQISMGAPFTVKLSDEDLKRIHYNPIEVAKIEYEQGVIPIDVRRKLPE